ncbi:MAG TPA: hypothetical protein VGW75_17885 [Solirubrobacteraceae bacterium]|nr:hypothetical protein [Solirubrobacteraceae bacterium]
MATLTLDMAQGSLLDEAAPGVDERDAERGAVAAPGRDERAGERGSVGALGRDERDERDARAAGALPGRTLDEVVARTWSALRVARAAACLLCGGEVVPRYGSGAHPVGGACRSCGTELS